MSFESLQLQSDRDDVDDALKIEIGLSAKDIDFLELIDTQIETGKRLTDPQRKWLDDIFDRCSS